MLLVGKALSAHYGLLPIVREGTVSFAALVRTLFVGFLICQFWGYSYAQCGSVSSSTIPLYWEANTEPDIDHYNVYRSLTSGFGYSVFGTTSQGADPISFTDLTPLATGYYVVTAVNTNGVESGFSNELCAQLSGGGGSGSNDAPVITAQAALTTSEETALGITPADLTVSDPDNSYPADFTLAVQDGTNYMRVGNTVTPDADFNGTLTVPVTVNDGTANSNIYNLSVTVSASNDAPVITAQGALTTTEETALGITLAVQDGTNYTRVGSTLTPAADFNGTLTVPVTVNDGTANSNIYNLSVTVTASNDAPVITAQAALTTAEETALTITLADVTVSDPDNSYPADFTLAVQNGVNYTRAGNTLTPAADFNGTLTVPVMVNDGTADSNVFTLSVSVTAVNDPPEITGQTALAARGESRG